MICEMQCIFHFSQQFFTPSLKIVIPKQYKKGKSVFSLTETKLILVPMCHVKREQLFCSCIYTKTERKWSQLFKETTWAVKLSRHWSGCKCTNIQTCFSMHCQHTPLCFWYIALFFFSMRLVDQPRRQQEVIFTSGAVLWDQEVVY